MNTTPSLDDTIALDADLPVKSHLALVDLPLALRAHLTAVDLVLKGLEGGIQLLLPSTARPLFFRDEGALGQALVQVLVDVSLRHRSGADGAARGARRGRLLLGSLIPLSLGSRGRL